MPLTEHAALAHSSMSEWTQIVKVKANTTAEIRMLICMCGVTKLDRNNESGRNMQVQESMLEWYGHSMRREEDYVGERVMVMEVQGKRRKGRPKWRWVDWTPPSTT